MTSKEALERIKLHKYIKCEVCDETMLKGCYCCNNELKNSEEFKTIEKDLEEKEETQNFPACSELEYTDELPLVNNILKRNNEILSSLVQLNDVLQKLDNNTIVTVYDISNKILYDGSKEDIYKSNLVIDNLYIDNIKIYADKIVDPFMLILVKELN